MSFAPGTSHTIDAPPVQDNGSGTRYLSTGPVSAKSACGTPRQSVTINLKTQYSLSLTPDPGGAVTLADASTPGQWQDAGVQLTLTAAPSDGFMFTGWEGDCAGAGACMVTMDQPRNVIAHFAPKP